MANKMTKVEGFTAIKAILENTPNIDLQLIELMEHEIELTAKRNATRSSKPTKAQLERQEQYDKLVDWLAENANVTCAEVANFMGVSIHSASGLLTQLRKAGKVKRTYEGKTPVYSLGNEQEGE